MNSSVPVIGVVIGAAILLFGRKLFWLFVAALGFAMGLEIAAYFMREPPVWMTLLVALVLGVLGALLAILLQKLAIAVAGFIAGGRIAWAAAAAFWVDHAHYRGITFVIGGILGALLLLALFDWVLILLSSIEGAHLIAALGKSFGESASDLSGRSSDEDFHWGGIVAVQRVAGKDPAGL